MVTIRTLAEAILLFHGGSPWTAEKCRSWEEITGHSVATTTVLRDLARGALAQLDAEVVLRVPSSEVDAIRARAVREEGAKP